MIKTLFLLGALLALPLRAAMLPLSAETQAYADTLTELTFCYPVLQRPPYLEGQGGLLISQMKRQGQQLPVPLRFERWAN